MASFLILLHGSAYANQSSRSALKYAQAVITKGHELKAVFFYSEAVYHANSLAIIPADEANVAYGFKQLNTDSNIPLLLCVTAAEKRGVIDAQQAQTEAFEHHNLDESFTVAGLAEMAGLAGECDHLIQFR
jgi:tRNA 2-thiouridine synthesizing protein D